MKNEILLNGESLNTDKKFFSRIGFNYLIFAVSAIIIQIIVMNGLILANINILDDFNVLTIITAICSYVLPLPIIVYLMRKIEAKRLETQRIGLITLLRYIAVTFTLMWIGNIIGLAITALISAATPLDVTNPVQTLLNSTDIWLNLVLISIIAPIFEEFFFRKLLIDRTIKYGAQLSILLSALMFGLFHGNLNQFFYTFLMGGFFAYVYIKTGKLVYPIILHIIINLMGSVVSLFVIESVQRLFSGTVIASDMIIVVGYIIILLAAFLIGIISLLNYKSARLDHIKTEIMLAQPLRTVILNYGMIFFIAFCIFQMAYQMLA